MPGFRSLLWREWRDIRSVALGVAVVAFVISLIVQHFMHQYAEPIWAAETLCPMLTALFTWIVASDLVAADVRTRRAATMAMLPVPLGRLWTAKALFLVLATVIFHALMLTLQAGIYVVAGQFGQVPELLAHVGNSWAMLVFIAHATAAILLCSTLGLRSIVAALVGIGLVAGLVRALDAIGWVRPLMSTWVGIALIPASAVFLVLASRAAFVQGRAHTGRRLRPLIVGLAVLGAFVVPAGAYAKVRATSYYDFTPRDRDLMVHALMVAPRGDYVALTVDRGYPGNGSARTWVVRLEDGALFQWARPGETISGWNAANQLVSWAGATSQRLGHGRAAGSWWLHPETGDVIAASGSLAGRDRQVLRQWSNPVPWGRVASQTTTALSEHWVNVTTTGEQCAVQSKGAPIPLADEGVVVLCDAQGRYMRVDTIAGTERVLADDEEYDRINSWNAVSASRRFLVIGHKQRHRVIDTDTGETVWRPSSKLEVGAWAWAPTGVDRLVVYRGTPRRARALFDPAARREVSIDHLMPQDDSATNYITDTRPLPDGRVIVVRRVGGDQDVLLLDTDGRIERVLYANDGKD